LSITILLTFLFQHVKELIEMQGARFRVRGVYSAIRMPHTTCLSNHHCRSLSGLYYKK